MTRNYKYALRLKPAQAQVIDALRRKARNIWNTLVIRTRLIYGNGRDDRGDIGHGHRDEVSARLLSILENKKQVGMACAKFPQIRRNPNFQKLPPERQQALLDQIKATRLKRRLKRTAGRTKNGHFKDRKLAVEFACESVSRDYQNKACHDLPSALFHNLISQFRDSAQLWVAWKPRAGAPRFKKRSDNVTVCAQANRAPVIGKNFVDLSLIHPVLANVRAIVHRSLPEGTKVKQVALNVDNVRSYAVYAIQGDASIFTVDLGDPGNGSEPDIIGIDPGVRTPATAATQNPGFQQKIVPKNAARGRRVLKKLRRIQRKADRQLRANNPHCFRQDGTWIKGKRITTTSAGMKHTARDYAQTSGRLANRRKESYLIAARELLRRTNTIRIGNWRPPQVRGKKTTTRGQKSQKNRNLNRKVYDNAISTLVGILQDYAKRSRSPRKVEVINEMLTTRTCPDCRTIQSKKISIDIRTWSCEKCGKQHDRDVAAARNLADPNFLPPSAATAGAQPVS